MKNAMEYKGYFGTVEYSESDNILFGKIIWIDSLISYEGSSVNELRKDFEAAVDDYLKLCAEKGIRKTVKTARQSKAMIAFDSMRQRASEEGYMNDQEIEAEIKAARQGE